MLIKSSNLLSCKIDLRLYISRKTCRLLLGWVAFLCAVKGQLVIDRSWFKLKFSIVSTTMEGGTVPQLTANLVLEKLRNLSTREFRKSQNTEIVNLLIQNDSVIEEMKNSEHRKELEVLTFKCSLRYSAISFWGFCKKLIETKSTLQFCDILPFVPTMIGSANDKRTRVMSLGFVQVCLLSLCFPLITAQIPETDFRINDNFILISSKQYNTEILEFTEQFSLDHFVNMEKFLNKLLKKADDFKSFSPLHSRCSQIGYRPHLIDDIEKVIKIARSNKLNNVVMTHFESSYDNQFATILRLNKRGEYECLLDFSENRISRLLSANIYRLAPAYKHSLSKYREQMINSFRGENGACLNEGILYDKNAPTHTKYDYNISFPVAEPALERCASICGARNVRSGYASDINQLTARNLSIANCQLYSYSLANQTCFLKFSATRDNFQNLEKYSTFDGLVVSGGPNCQSRFNTGFPSILVNNKTIDARKICSFSKKNIVFSNKNYRCLGLFQLLHFPIIDIKKDMKQFLAKLNLRFHERTRIRRGVLSFILQNILKAGNVAGFAKIGIFPEQIDAFQILKRIGNSLFQIGHFRKIVTLREKKQNFIDANLSEIIRGNEDYAKIMTTDLRLNYNNVLISLKTWLNEIIDFYVNLINSSSPYRNATKVFVSNESYVYSFFISHNMISRQFIKTRASLFSNSTNLSLIPISNKFYWEATFWKSMVRQGSVEQENRCLVSLLQGDSESTAKCTGNDIKRQEVSENVFILNHQFGAFDGFLLVINRQAIFEITCVNSSVINSCKGFCVIACSAECLVLINSQLMRNQIKSLSTFDPFVILNRNESLINVFEKQGVINLREVLQFLLILLILVVVFIYGILKCYVKNFCCNKMIQKNTNVELTENEEVQMSFISKS